MAFQEKKRGATSQLLTIWIGDSSSTTGAGLPSLVYNSAGLVWKYQESDQASATTVTTATMTEGTWASGGFIESALGHGFYQIGIPDAALTSGSEVNMILYGATNMVETPVKIKLVAVDDQDVAGGGMSNLNATVSSRATQTSVDTIDDFLDTEIAAIKAQTDLIPSDPADASDIASQFTTVNTKLDAIDDFLDTEITDIQTQIGAAGTGLTAIPWNSAWDTEVQSEVNDALVAINLDYLFATDYNPSSPPGNAAAYLNEIVENDAGAIRFTAQVLELGPTGGGGGPSAADIADAVWDEAKTGHTTAGTFGEVANSFTFNTVDGDSAVLVDVVGWQGFTATTDGNDKPVVSVGFFRDVANNRDGTVALTADNDIVNMTRITDTYNIVSNGTYGNAAIQAQLTAVAPSYSVSSSFAQTYGTVISGTYSSTATGDGTKHVLAPELTNGLSATYTFSIGTTNKPSKVAVDGYWSGSGDYCEVYAYNYDTAAFDKISGTTSTTRLNHRTADYLYLFDLAREYVDTATGNVQIKFVSASVDTADRLYLDKIFVYYQTEAASEGGLTAQNVWEYSQRQLTGDGLDLILAADGTTLWKDACIHGAVVLMGVTTGAGTTIETFTKYGYVVTSTNNGTNRTVTSAS